MNDDDQPPPRVSTPALIAMGAIISTFLFVAIFANWQNAHRQKIESVTVTRFTPSPSPPPSRERQGLSNNPNK